ncbi:PLP-dependent transferase [Leucogyrophana mollusca]|uniref:PLP-dependent transferase n=1 Tax=Leucogyrophana mollusca TaxID=85980 RepID=A0ACB8B6N0_9AGAM|nr:PLP-dependent transferase [Leucogyrophana mollusca]
MTSSSPDLSHHLSGEARERLPNPMKVIWRRVNSSGRIDVANMANGDPHHSLYPFKQLMFEVPSVAEEPDPVPAWRTGNCPTQFFHSYKDEPCALSLRNAFQYTHGAGLPECQKTLTDLTQFFYAPPDHAITLTLGNSDGITKLFRLLGERGDHFLTDEFSFPGMTNAPLSYGIKWVGVKMDAGGMIPEEMEKILQNWNEASGRRPHVLYIIPVGQNPTGTTLSLERRQKIYAIAQKWDLIIIEDDPYYFIQFDQPPVETPSDDQGNYSKRFAKSLIPTILSMDTDGRVLRIDSFSKIIAPGMRLGWITSNRMFHDKLVTYTDSGPQHPHAFGQAFVTEMLSEKGWQMDGFCRWLQSLRLDYQRRRDFLLEVFRREVEPTGYASVNVPEGGMFVWIEVYFERHPRYRSEPPVAGSSTVAPRTNVEVLLLELLEKFIELDVVIMPSVLFAIEEHPRWIDDGARHVPIRDRTRFYRATFAGTEETIEKGMTRLGRALREFFDGPPLTSRL